jgi:sigma-B regulation protein RsbU (phosphoserine phosphatase)
MDIVQAIIIALYFIFGGILLFLAYSIIRDNISARLNRITGLMLFFAALGPVFLAFGAIVKPIASAEAPFEESVLYNLLYIWELFFPAFLLFSLVFPFDRVPHMRRRKLRYLLFVPQAFHLLLVVAFSNPEKILGLLDVESGEGFTSLIVGPLTYLLKWVVLGFTLILSSEKTLFSILNLIYVALGVYFIFRGRALVTNERLRQQSTAIIWGISLAVGFYTAVYLVPDIFSLEISSTIRTGVLISALLVGGGSITWSIVKHQFLDVTVLVRQSLVYTISSGILVGAYILFVGQINRLISSIFGETTAIVNIAFIVVALILFQPINTRLDNLIKRFFIRSSTDYRVVMEELSRRLISVPDLDQLRSMIERTLISSILVERIYFVLFDDKLDEYALLPSEGFSRKVIIDRNDLFLGGVGQLEKPTTIDSLMLYRYDSELYTEMEKRRVQLILPLKDAEHLLGFLALTSKISGYRYNAEDITMLGVITNQLVTVLTNARLYLDSLEKQRLSEEMNMARQIQLDLLPKSPPVDESYKIFAYSQPCRTIGGDFYDFIPRDDGSIAVVIADASGKGLPAALLVTQIQAMLRSEIGNENEISKILCNINKYVTKLTSSEKFATLFYGEYDPGTRRFRYSNAGHNYPLLVRSDGSHEFLDRGGLLIGAFDGAQYLDGTVQLYQDDLLFLYTDGLSEAMNESDEEYGEQRIIDYIVEKRHLDPEEIGDGILEDKKTFEQTDPPLDDTTLVVMKIRKGGSGGQTHSG